MPPRPARLSRRRAGAALVAMSLVLAGCGAKRGALTQTAAFVPSTSSPTSSSTSSSTSTSTTVPGPTVSPLTGLAPASAANLGRPALVVKVDNVDQARPQAGLNAADVVFEEVVESQLTRLIALYQSTDANRVGPVRSTRTTDIDVVSALDHPLYAYSGGNKNFVKQLDAAPIVDVGAATYAQPYYFYSGPHAAPHDLYANTVQLFHLAPPGSRPPPALFAYRAVGASVGAAGASPATTVSVNFGMINAGWTWNAPTQMWDRTQDGAPDLLQDGTQIAAANVVVQVVGYTTDGVASGEGISPPPPIPLGETVGTGTALIFTGGMVVHATWSKASPTAVTQYSDANGAPVALTPGRTWVELAPTGAPFAVG